MHRRANMKRLAAAAFAVFACTPPPSWAGDDNCPQASFTKSNFERIEEGMTVEAINELLGCVASPHLTFRKGYATSFNWSTVGGSLKYIQIGFDAEGRKVQRLHPAFEFKTSTGF